MRLGPSRSTGARDCGPANAWRVLLAGLLLVTAVLRAEPKGAGKWVGTWVSAQYLVDSANQPPSPGLAGASLRQIIQPSLGGSAIRVTFSNVYGDAPLTLASATVARSGGGSRVDPASVRAVTFAGQDEVTIQAGTSMISDPIEFDVRAFENLAVTVYCAALPPSLTGHPGSRTTSYLLPGKRTGDADFPSAVTTDRWYLLAAADVWADPSAAAILVIGDSITDGRGSTTNQNDRWPNLLGRRLHADPRFANIAVLNQGIGGNRVLRRGNGPSALERFDRDVLAPPGVRWLVIFEGINDVGTAMGARNRGEPAPTVHELIAGYQQMILRARAHDLVVYGATLMPFKGFAMYYSPESEADRQAANRWIRSSGQFDGVIDFDSLTRDPEDPERLLPQVDGGDHLHPSANGYKLMAEGVDLSLFFRPKP